MITLAIDSAGAFCSAALARAADTPVILSAASERIGKGHAERLMPMIEDVLADAGVTYQDLGAIAVTTGPGSFTGLRIGISAARGLALALGLDAAGLSVLDVLIAQARQSAPDMTIVAVLDAGRGDCFVQAAGADGSRLLAARKMPLPDAASWIGGLAGPVHLIGAADRLGGPAVGGVTQTDHADIEMLARMAAAGSGASPARPLYLRSPDAKPQAGKAVARA